MAGSTSSLRNGVAGGAPVASVDRGRAGGVVKGSRARALSRVGAGMEGRQLATSESRLKGLAAN